MPDSSPPPSPPPPAPNPSPSKKRLLTCPKSSQGLYNISVSNCLSHRGKRTRDLPNLSDCHGCGLRINYINPKDRLQPLESVWRIVLLCKKCIKLVNSGQICPYCFRDTVNLVSDCVRCSDCERFIHKNCIVKYSCSTPWSYSCKESGLGFSVCIDCWVPKLLKNSVRICRRKERADKCVGELSASKGASRGLRKGKDCVISLEEVVKDANCVVEKKIAMAIKAKEKALRKAVVAKNAVLLASNALDLVAKKDCSSKKSEGLDTSIGNGSSVDNVTRFADDAELAFQLHRAMNSSPRISKNACSMNFSCFHLLKLKDSISVSPKSIDLGSDEGGNVGVCSNTNTTGNQKSNVSETSACIRTNGSGSAISSPRLKPELRTYRRNKKKRKECQENGNGYVGTSFGVAGKFTAGDDSGIVTEPQSCQLDEQKQELHVNDARTSSPESCYTNIVRENGSGNTMPGRYALKYSKRMAGCRRDLYKEVNFAYKEANSNGISSQKEIQASASRLPIDCSMECRAWPDSSLRSCVVNPQAWASIGGSSQEEAELHRYEHRPLKI